MKISIYENKKVNSGILSKKSDKIEIKEGRWIQGNISHPMEYDRIYCFDKRYAYFLYHFGKRTPKSGIFISLNWFQNQFFLFMQKDHWLFNSDKIWNLITSILSIISIIISILALKK